MTKVQVVLALALLVAAGLVAFGVWCIYPPAGLITAGVLLAVVAVVMASEVTE